MLGDARDVGRAVVEISELSRNQLGAIDPFCTIGQLPIDPFDHRVVRCDPSHKFGELLGDSRIGARQFRGELVSLGECRVVGQLTPLLFLLRLNFAEPLAKPLHRDLHAVAAEGGILHGSTGCGHVQPVRTPI